MMIDAAPSGRTPYLLVLVLWFAGLLAGAQFAKISVLFPEMRALYPEAGNGIGFLVSVLSLFGIIFGIAAGLLVSRAGYRRSLLVALALGAAMSALQIPLPGFEMMLASRVIEGLSHLIIVVAAPTLIAQLGSDRDRPLMMTLWSTFFGVAFALVSWGGLPLVAVHGESIIFIIHTICMIIVAALLWAMLPSIRPPGAQSGVNLAVIIDLHRQVYSSARIIAPAAGWLFYTLTFASLLTLLPDTVPPDQRLWISGAMPITSIIASIALGGLLLRFMPAVTVIIIGFLLSAIFATTLAFAEGSAMTSLALLASMGLIQSASFAAVPQLNEALEDRALANGALAQTGNFGNTLGTPLLLFVSTSLGFTAMMTFAAALFAFGIAMHLMLANRRDRA